LEPGPSCNLRNGPLRIAYALELFPPFPLQQSSTCDFNAFVTFSVELLKFEVNNLKVYVLAYADQDALA